jgi:hypothetical protein
MMLEFVASYITTTHASDIGAVKILHIFRENTILTLLYSITVFRDDSSTNKPILICFFFVPASREGSFYFQLREAFSLIYQQR